MSMESASVPDWVVTLGDVRAWLCQRGGIWADALAETRPLRMACDQEMSDAATRITPGCEVAFFPPVTGG